MRTPKTEFPNDVDLEKKLLSAMMMKGGAVVPVVADIVTVEDFFRPAHQLVYKAILDASNKYDEFNGVLVLQELLSSGDMDKIGGHTYFTSILNVEFTNAYAKDYAERIKELSRQRQLIQAANNLYEQATSGLTSDEILAQAEKLFSPKIEEKQSTQKAAVDIAADAYQRALDLSQIEGLSGVDTGFQYLNVVTNGLQRGELILLAAR